MTFYGADLAYIHAAGFGDLAENAAPEIVRLLRSAGIAPRGGVRPRIVEVGCGSGIVARHLSDRGYDVLGIDVSPHMIRLARARAPAARFRVGSLASAAIPPCSAVVAVGEVVSYVAGGLVSLRRFFNRVHRSLCPGGLLVFDFIESAERRTFGPKSRGGEDWAVVARADVDSGGRVLTRRITSFRKIHGEYHRTIEVHRVNIYDRGDIVDALRAVGFSARVRRSYGSYRLQAGDVAVIAQKL